MRGRWGGGGQQGGGDREEGNREEVGRGQWGGRGKRCRKHMEWVECGYSFFCLCLPVQRRVPQLVYTNKTGDCLSVCLFICSAMGGQTARPNGLKFGG